MNTFHMAFALMNPQILNIPPHYQLTHSTEIRQWEETFEDIS